MKKIWIFIFLLLFSFLGKTNDSKSSKKSKINNEEDTYDVKDHEAVQSQLKNFQKTLKKIQKDQGIQDPEPSELKQYEEILNPKKATQRPSSSDKNEEGRKGLKETQSQLIKYQKTLMKIHQKQNKTSNKKDNLHKKPTQSQLSKYRKMLKGKDGLPLQKGNNTSNKAIQSQLEQYQEVLKNIQKRHEIQQKIPSLESSSHKKDHNAVQPQLEKYLDMLKNIQSGEGKDQSIPSLSDENIKSIESLNKNPSDEKQNLQQKLQSFKGHALAVEQEQKNKNALKRWWDFFFGKRKDDEPKASEMVASMLMLFQDIPKENMEVLIIERTDGTIVGRILNRYPKIVPFAVLLLQDKTAIPSLAGILDNREKLGIFIICNLIVLFFSIRWSFKNRKSKYPLLIRIKRRLTATAIFWSCRLGLIVIFFKTQFSPFIDLLKKYTSS